MKVRNFICDMFKVINHAVRNINYETDFLNEKINDGRSSLSEKVLIFNHVLNNALRNRQVKTR